MAVFNKGICKGLNGRIPVGGHREPISTVGWGYITGWRGKINFG